MKTIILLLFAILSLSGAPCAPKLLARVQQSPDSLFRVWVFLKTETDLTHQTSRIQACGLRIRYTSRWFNAVSGTIAGNDIHRLTTLPFVQSVRSVQTFRQSRTVPEPTVLQKSLRRQVDPYYGDAYDQLNLIGLIQCHKQGLVSKTNGGQGIRIALFDSGFKTNLPVFAHFTDSTILAKRDYVAGMIDTAILFDTTVYDDSLDYPAVQSSKRQQEHGTNVLSLIAGLEPGTFVGIAPFAQFVLLKTERILNEEGRESETQAEEDAWVAACEWVVDSIGVDIITTSLGYHYDFTDERDDYTLTDLNGDSLLITQAADKAAAAPKGVLVLAAVGNEGYYGSGSLSAPADGDSVLAVGGCDLNGYVYDNTSFGPTLDGRAKPDISAPASGVYFATSTSYISSGSGTSFATPLTAGAAALLLQRDSLLKGHPYEAMARLKRTAYFPSNIPEEDRTNPRYGTGIVNIWAALLDTVVNNPYRIIQGPAFFPLTPSSEKKPAFILRLSNQRPLDSPSLRINLYSLSGKLVRRFSFSTTDLKPGINLLTWDGKNRHGQPLESGVYLVRAEYIEKGGIPVIWQTKTAIIP